MICNFRFFNSICIQYRFLASLETRAAFGTVMGVTYKIVKSLVKGQ